MSLFTRSFLAPQATTLPSLCAPPTRPRQRIGIDVLWTHLRLQFPKRRMGSLSPPLSRGFMSARGALLVDQSVDYTPTATPQMPRSMSNLSVTLQQPLSTHEQPASTQKQPTCNP